MKKLSITILGVVLIVIVLIFGMGLLSRPLSESEAKAWGEMNITPTTVITPSSFMPNADYGLDAQIIPANQLIYYTRTQSWTGRLAMWNDGAIHAWCFETLITGPKIRSRNGQECWQLDKNRLTGKIVMGGSPMDLPRMLFN